MSVRDYAVLYLGGGRSQRSASGGGNTLLTTGTHRLDGPEHSEALDATRLDASTDAHGLMPKLSGDPTYVFRGDGTQGPGAVGAMVPYFIASGDTFTVPLDYQALYSMTIDNEGILDVVGFLLEVD